MSCNMISYKRGRDTANKNKRGNTMNYKINLDVYNDDFEPICFEGLTNSESVYMACDKAVSYSRAQLNKPIDVEIFIEIEGDIKPVYVGNVRIGVTRAVSVYRMYTKVIDKLEKMGVII